MSASSGEEFEKNHKNYEKSTRRLYFQRNRSNIGVIEINLFKDESIPTGICNNNRAATKLLSFYWNNPDEWPLSELHNVRVGPNGLSWSVSADTLKSCGSFPSFSKYLAEHKKSRAWRGLDGEVKKRRLKAQLESKNKTVGRRRKRFMKARVNTLHVHNSRVDRVNCC